MTLTITGDEEWRLLAEYMAQGADPQLWPQDQRFGTAESRKAHENELDKRLSAWTVERHRDLLCTKLRRLGLPCAPLHDSADLLQDPQLAARNFWQWLNRDHVGQQPQPSPPYRLGKEPYRVTRPAPTLGQHNAKVLGEILGLGEAELAKLQRDLIIGTTPVLP